MSLYDRCIMAVEKNSGVEKLLSEHNKASDIVAQSLPLSSDKRFGSFLIYYISDIHLEQHICRWFPNGATDKQVEEFVNEMVSNLLTDEIALLSHEHIILFGGDVASDFALSNLFFSRFIKTWDEKNKADYQKKREAIRTQNREYRSIKQVLSQWKRKHEWTKTAARDLLEYSDKRVPEEIKKNIRRERELSNLIKGRNSFEEVFYMRKWHVPKKRIYAVLGNHELCNFDTFDECANAYQKLFDEVGIAFLNNSEYYIRKYNNPFLNDVAIIGGIGFAGHNDIYNANCGLYGNAVSREQELKLTNEWEDYFKKTSETMRKEKALLIVLTHNPPHDWSRQNRLISNCIYFYGHDHRNTSYYIEETNTYAYADNQIGYEAFEVSFKKTSINLRMNPFAGYSDGMYVISTEDYCLFNRFSNIYVDGTKRIENYVRNGAKLYMIKEKRYYGFFVVNENKTKGLSVGTFICVGGRLKKLNNTNRIDYYRQHFLYMVNTYLTILSPYRMVQERIAKTVKSFGGSGTIHGFIVDIDFYNHIMLNPVDGKITFYYSPMFGMARPYDSLHELLADQNPVFLGRYLEQAKLAEKHDSNLISTQSVLHSDFEIIDIKNSPYADSMRMNQLQRLFDARVLRDWDDSLPIISNDSVLPSCVCLPED